MKENSINYQEIDYTELAKYQKDETYVYDNENIALIIKDIENLLNDFSLKDSSKILTKSKFKLLLNQYIEDLKKIILNPIKNNKILSNWIVNILDLANEMYFNEYYIFYKHQTLQETTDQYIIDHVKKIKNSGLTRIDFDKYDIEKLKTFIEKIPRDQQNINRLIPNKFNLFYNKLLRKYKLSRIASNYTKTKTFPYYSYTIRYTKNNDPSKWSSLDGTITHDLDTLHLDRFCPSVTLLIYLSNVHYDDGPFQYIKGSNQFIKSKFINCMHTGVSFSIFPGTEKPHDYEKDEQRVLFMQLPKVMQGNLVIGSFINEDSHNYNILSNNHKIALGSEGAAFIFDGHKTLHTGGRPIDGKRLALFQAFTPYYKLLNRLDY
ncbi:hypothetical protein HN836_01400 [Candidatus Woesearchaeota archaeon]|jgi:hypothetical protein|nr:hypothetical protein [Candidatus Woesearchaeota archaeon]